MPNKSNFYSLFSHTADLGILIRGNSFKELFRHAGMALMEQLVDNKAPETGNRIEISVSGNDPADLMVKWLSEILYLFEGEGLVVTGIYINSINRNKISANLTAMEYDTRHHEYLREIKAVTYHQIEVKEKRGLWTAKVIFDL